MKKYYFLTAVPASMLLFFVITGCQKYLDEKPNQAFAVPSSLQDLQALLDTYTKLNNTDPGSSEASADNYYITYTDWSALSEPDRRLYTWENDHVYSSYPNDWSKVYNTVFTANVVLDNIEQIEKNNANTADWNNIKGSALVFRSKAFLQAAIIWCGAYNAATANVALGIPLRTDADFNKASFRSSLQETYGQITAGLREAAALLPATPGHVMRPSKPAAYALLARTFLAMNMYDSCRFYADACLQSKNTLLNYNSLNASATFPISQFNTEVIMENLIPVPAILNNTRAKIDSALYASYAANDLRKLVFFKNNNNGSFGFKGSYEGGGNLFGGIAVDEVYLMRAECYARAGNITAAMSDLNTLLQTRWKAGAFTPLTAASAAIALQMILTERRKELLMRGLRWMDLKRLNEEGANIALSRMLNGQSFSLPAKDPRYAIALPEDVIILSGIAQNPR